MPQEVTPYQVVGGLVILMMLLSGVVIDIVLLRSLSRNKLAWRRNLGILRHRPWDLFDGIYLLLVMALFFAGLIFLSEVLDKCGIILSNRAEKILQLAETVVMQAVYIFAINKLRRRNHTGLRRAFSTANVSMTKSFGTAIIWYLAIIPLVFLASAVITPLLELLNIPLEPQLILREFTDTDLPHWIRSGLFVLAIIIAPIVEELTFRGVALPIAAKHASPGLAILTVSTAFALIHYNIAAVAPLLVLAIGLSLAYIHTRTILVPIMIHSIFNTVSLATLLLLQSGM